MKGPNQLLFYTFTLWKIGITQEIKRPLTSLTFFYKREGKGEVLFCIHGFPTASIDYEPIWPSLTSQFDVIANDLIGLGRSEKPQQKLSVALQADVIESLLVSLGITQAHILAHDLGDTIAQELLARQAENKSNVKWLSCVFLNGGMFPETHRPIFMQKLLISPIGFLIAKLTSKKSLQGSLTKVFGKEHPPTKKFIDEARELLSENNGLSMLPRLIQYMEERKVYRERWVSPIVNSPIPIRLIDVVQDPISGQHMADRYREVINNADIVLIKEAGHYPHVECPEKVLEAFLAFHKQL